MRANKLPFIILLSLLMPPLSLGQGCNSYKSFVGHTMCIYREAACPGRRLIDRGLTVEQRTEVINAHNYLRQAIVDGKVRGVPPAQYMNRLEWDEELATIAQRAADQCVFQHDKERNVAGQRYSSVGQNVYQSGNYPVSLDTKPYLTEATISWFNEINNPGFPASHIYPFRFIPGAGHFTQLAWAETKAIGCGYAMYEEGGWSQKLIFCNYGPSGNVIGGRMYIVRKLEKPYPTIQKLKHNQTLES